jgi:gas vesicle protein
VVSPTLAIVLARGLDPQPARRFPSLVALLDQLVPAAPRPRPRRLAILIGATSLVLAGAAAATVLAPRPAGNTQEVRELKAEIRQLQTDKDEYQRTVTRLSTEARSGRADLEQTMQVLKGLIAERDRKISALEGKLAEVERGPGPALVVQRPRPIDLGLSPDELTVVAQSRKADLNGCFTEWSERTGRATVFLKVTYKVMPTGRVPRAEVTGLVDQVVPECVAALFRGMRYPPRELTTSVVADLGFADGKTTITASRVGTEDPPPLIDSPGQ